MLQKISADQTLVEQKIRELVDLLDRTEIEDSKSKVFQEQITHALQKSVSSRNSLKPYKDFARDESLSRIELLEGMEKLLTEHKIDSKISKKYIRYKHLQRIITGLMAIVLICTGFAMIIMPAPPSFEIFTIFYFNANDGVTIMDLVSLLIILGGIFLFISSVSKK